LPCFTTPVFDQLLNLVDQLGRLFNRFSELFVNFWRIEVIRQ